MNFIHLFEKEKLIRYRKDYAVGAYVRLRKKEAKGWSQVEGKITYANNSYFVVKTENYNECFKYSEISSGYIERVA